jgi:hypothetical protein
VLRRLLYAAAAALVLSAGLLPATAATADSGSITFGTASGDGSGNLAVTVTSDDQLGSVTVYLWPGAPDTGSPALTTSDVTEQGSFASGQQQTWVIADPASDLAGLQPGSYAVTADATDADGDQSVTDQPVSGSFDFFVQPTVHLSSLSTTAPAQAVSLTGQLGCATLSCYAPGSWPALPVTVSDSDASQTWQGSTASDGSFSIGVTGTPGDHYSASVAATPATLPAESAAVQDLAVYAPASISAAATPAPYGKQQVTGTLTSESGLSQLVNLSGVAITATASGGQQATATTSANGSFSMVLPAVTGTTAWTVSSKASDQTTPFVAAATTSVSATQTWPATLSAFKATLNKYYTLTVSGCLSSAVTPAPPTDYPAIQIQYERTTAGPWVGLGWVSTTQMTNCRGAAFLAQGGAPAAAAYYRAYFPGDQTYQPATGGSVRAALIPTRFISFRSSAATVPAPSSKVTVSGRLQYQSGTWHDYAYQPVQLIYSKNDKTWYSYAWLKTNSTGYFGKTFADTVGTAYWSANYDGNATHLVTGAPVVKVTVRARNAALAASALGPLAQPVARLTSPGGGDGPWRAGAWPFVMAVDPLLIIMGVQQ